MLGKIEGRRRRGRQRMRCLDGITDSWTWVWASSRLWWWTGKPGMLQSMESQRVGDNWVTELNWLSFYEVKNRLSKTNGGKKKKEKKKAWATLCFMRVDNVYFVSVFTICLSSGISIWVKPFFKWGNQSSKRLSKLFNMLQLVLGRERIRIQASLASKEAYWF